MSLHELKIQLKHLFLEMKFFISNENHSDVIFEICVLKNCTLLYYDYILAT